MSRHSVSPVTTPAHLLNDAKQISTNAASPARYRSVISRSYYAAYHAATERMGFRRDQSKPTGIHSQLLQALKSSSDGVLKAVGTRLGGLYGRRIVADYQLNGFVTKQMATDAIEDAEEIIVDLLGIEPESASSSTP